MQQGSGTTTITITEANTDIQFAVRPMGKVDWHSRPATALKRGLPLERDR
jgi:hypothetical protein